MPFKRRKPLLSSTRPPRKRSQSNSSKSLSSHIARTLIRTHHNLQKRLSAALSAGDTELATSLQSQIAAQGGLESYQRASILGQSAERGGDSGRVLKDWVNESLSSFEDAKSRNSGEKNEKNAAQRKGGKIKMLEVGALKVDNACSQSPLFVIERIDLHSQHPSITTQDFMQRPLPATPEELFDIVSLSLVLNYVGTPTARGDMLRRVEQFLRHPDDSQSTNASNKFEAEEAPQRAGTMDPAGEVLIPGLFLVLPAPCVMNSRYLDEKRLEAMMRSLGYTTVRRKVSAKLVYYFFRLVGKMATRATFGKKEEIRKGTKRNNFTIVL